MGDIPLLVFDTDQAIRSRLAMQLGDAAEPVGTLEALTSRIDGTPVVLLLGPTCSRGEDLGGVARLINGRPEIGAILIAAELSTELLQSALRSGVRDVLAAPVDTAQLAEAVSRVVETVGGSGPQVLVDGAPGAGGRVITVFSTKGGAGKSMLAANVAVVLAKESARQGDSRPVVLVDADLQFGDVTVMLHLTPQHTIVDVVKVGS